MVKATVQNLYGMVMKITVLNMQELQEVCYQENLDVLDYIIFNEGDEE